MTGPVKHLVQLTEADPILDDLLEEFTNRLEACVRVDVEAYIAEHPERAEALRRMLPVIQVLAELDRSGAAVAADSSTGPYPPCPSPCTLDRSGAAVAALPPGKPDPRTALGQLGDYRLLREVGRGGMGIVYEAEQISLERRVALKVLPLASTLDARQLQRFHNEAHAAAQLHHTHIVPVHATGCERGVHFYAMQYVEGQTLAALIAELRQRAGRDPAAKGDAAAPRSAPTRTADPQRTDPYCPQAAPTRAGDTTVGPGTPRSDERLLRSAEFFRMVAELGIQAAEALAHAHQLGVIHRDIKPGNLLIEQTSLSHGERVAGQRLRLWVTDFGLAHVQSHAGLTLTGDLLGTLRYMSPEQALAKPVAVDHRTDIYSLGVTLYELLTLEPAFAGRDRQELLRQIAFEEPKPPRRLNRAVPAELETIVGKAMEKNLADRYATAQELADDLARFLKDEPIRARRPTLVQRARKWARRHTALVWSAAVVLLLAALMAGINAMWLARKRAETAAAVAAVLKEAKDLQGTEKWPEALAAARRAEALLQLGGGGDDLRQRVQELLRDLEMVGRLEEARLQRAAGAKGEGFDLEASHAAYAKAFAWYGLAVESLEPNEVAQRIRSCPIRLQLAAALDDWAGVQKTLKLATWRQLVGVARLADPDRWRDRLRDALEGNDPKALQEVAASVPDDNLSPATAVLLGRLSVGTGAAEQAVAVLQRVWQRHPGDFWVNEELGFCLHELQPPRLEEAVSYYIAAVALRPRSPGAHMNLGNALGDQGRLDRASTEYREALRLKEDYPEAHNNLGAALYTQGRLDDAIAEYREALRRNKDLAMAHNNLGVALYKKGELDGAIAECREALRLKKDYPEAHYNLGNALKAKGRLEEAMAEYLQAGRFKDKVVRPTIQAHPRTIPVRPARPGTHKVLPGHPRPPRSPRRPSPPGG
jgi:serine/threonine protein kinase/Flp pilus assembly protein TadD